MLLQTGHMGQSHTWGMPSELQPHYMLLVTPT